MTDDERRAEIEDCDHPTEVCTEGKCHMCGWVYDPHAPERKGEAVDVVAEFLHTGGPSLNADQAAIEIVGVLSRAGFLDRVRDARGDDEAAHCTCWGEQALCAVCASQPEHAAPSLARDARGDDEALLEATKREAACGRELAAAHARIAELEAARSPQGEDHEAQFQFQLPSPSLEDHEAGIEAAMRASYDRWPQMWGKDGKPKTYEECYGCAPLDHKDDRKEMEVAIAAYLSRVAPARPEQPPPDRLGGQPPAEPPEAP